MKKEKRIPEPNDYGDYRIPREGHPVEEPPIYYPLKKGK
jgi:hypothetical protein